MDLGVNDGLQLIDEGDDQMTDGQEDDADHDVDHNGTDVQQQKSGGVVMKRHPVILAYNFDKNDDYQKGDDTVADWDHNFLKNALKYDDMDQVGHEYDQCTVAEREDDHELDLGQYVDIDDQKQEADTQHYSEWNNYAVVVVKFD